MITCIRENIANSNILHLSSLGANVQVAVAPPGVTALDARGWVCLLNK